MPERAPEEGGGGFGEPFRWGIGFLSILPVGRVRSHPEIAARAAPWFLPAGLLLGGLLAGIAWGLAGFSPPVRAYLLVAAGFFLTRGLHLDGLADLADALGGGTDRARRLEILRDPSHGTFGVAAVVLSILGRILLLERIPAAALPLAVGLSVFSSRAAMILLLGGLPYVRPGGMGEGLAAGARRGGTRIPAVLLLAAVAVPGGPLPVAAAATVLLGMGLLLRRSLGGTTGDGCGATGEAVEIAMLAVFAAG